MQKIPKRIKILGYDFTVRQVPKLSDDDHGECNVIKREIRISTAYPLEQRWQTLQHETYHAILGLTGLSELLSDELEEAIVVALENGLSPIMDQLVPK